MVWYALLTYSSRLAPILGAVLLAASALLLMYVGEQGYYSQVFVGLSLAAAIFALAVAPPLVIGAALIEIALYAVAFIVGLIVMIFSLRTNKIRVKHRYV